MSRVKVEVEKLREAELAVGPCKDRFAEDPNDCVLGTEDFLGRVAGELDRLNASVRTVEQAIPALLHGRIAPLRSETYSALQELDLIGQVLTALAIVLREARHGQPVGHLEIGRGLANLNLESLIARLAVRDPERPKPLEPAVRIRGTDKTKSKDPSAGVDLF